MKTYKIYITTTEITKQKYLGGFVKANNIDGALTELNNIKSGICAGFPGMHISALEIIEADASKLKYS